MTRAATVLSAIVAICLSAGTAVIAHAQGYPDRPIKLVVPFRRAATDTTSRLVAQRLQAALGQSVIIENQGGAGGSIGARQVANAAPSGYTLLMGSVGTFGTQPLLYKLDYDPHKAFAPVAAATGTDKIIMVAGPPAGEDGAGAGATRQGRSGETELRQCHRHRPAAGGGTVQDQVGHQTSSIFPIAAARQ